MLRRATDISIFLGILIPLAALMGWQTGSPLLKSLVAGQVPMNPVTALVFLLFSFSLLASAHSKANPALLKLSRILAVLACAIVATKLLSFFGVDLKIDQSFFSQRLGSDPHHLPNRMAPNTAVSFLLLGIALFSLNGKTRGHTLLFQTATLLTGLVSFLVLIGYAYESKEFIQVSYFLPMAFNTALTFLILSIGILCSRPDCGFTEAFISSGPGGVLARRLLPVVIGLPILLGWLRILGQRHGLYDMEFGTAITIVILVAVSSGLIWWTALSLNLSDQRLQEQVLKLQTANEELEAFCAAASHDLRAPLTTIVGYTEILASGQGSGLTDEARMLIERILRSSRKMGNMIEGLLRLSRLGRQDLVRGKVNLSQMGEKILEDLKRENEKRKVSFQIDPNLVVSGDENLLESVLTNLLRNAWKYTSRTANPVIELGAEETEGRKTYFVADNGAGFDMAQADKLFQAFHRLHTSEEFEGTGIGLTTVKRIIQRHGGEIWAKAAPGQGATFFFTLS